MIRWHQWTVRCHQRLSRRSQWTVRWHRRMTRGRQPMVRRRNWTVYYQARMVTTRGLTGPLGELVSAMVVK